MYKKDPRAICAHTQKCEARTSINTLATNKHFKSQFIQYRNRIIELSSDQHCEPFHPLVISYNLIEVNDGVCWSLKDHAFKENPIEDYQVGKASFTEVIINEADKKTLHVANWKILMQEGYTTHNNKYLTAKAFLNASGCTV